MSKDRKFVEGSVYFTLFFHDQSLRLPEIETLVYVGENLSAGDGAAVAQQYFQSAASYQRNGLWTRLSREQQDALDDDPLRVFGDDSLDPICDIVGLIDQLNELASKLHGRPAA
jgi:hypothetical protein